MLVLEIPASIPTVLICHFFCLG